MPLLSRLVATELPTWSVRAAYDLCPAAVQTAALNAYGLQNRLRRARASTRLGFLAASETWPLEVQIRYTAERLRRILDVAFRSVPFYTAYRDMQGELAGPDEHVLGLLDALPVVSRDMLMAEPDAFMSHPRRRRAVAAHTSGTTGSPLTVYVDQDVECWNDALVLRRDLWAGYRPGDWIARLVGDPVVPLRQASPLYPWRASWTDRRLYLSSYHLSTDTAGRMAQELAKRRPAFLMGYPSTLTSLVRLADEAFGDWTPKAILYSSEPLHAHQRALLEQAFPVPIRGFYGCAERAVSATECEAGRYHLNVVDGCVQGQYGQAPYDACTYVTSLLNETMPLVRYAIGDTLRVDRQARCPCGRSLPVIADVVTKEEDVLVTESGRRISPSVLTWAFKDLAGLESSQIVQTSQRDIVVRVVVSPKRFAVVRDELSERLRQLTFDEFSIRVVRCDELQITAMGKSRFVVGLHD